MGVNIKIGIDLDGTAWKHRQFFIELVCGLQLRFHEVGILTAHTNLKDKDIDLWRNRGFPNPDFYISKVSGEESIPSREWKISKAKENKIDFIIDDFDTDEIKIIFTGN